ncbi:superoxide dismutase family protein [Acinetobacter sp. 10FS3-1]|uniref:superoxide dismutase family protein n=1 Tax=Acinetobacter sp. 10FS3-1 TaxID=2563897 RepID=UPI00157D6291|nr:superoxide dismutase family protein [Acinetobacter sp. 10FS3-1]QKQ70918.1 superoxide dismutase [Acinetobacter sp. 10FS3-1]
MSSFFKVTTLCALGAVLFTGCTSNDISTENVRTVSMHAVSAQGTGESVGTVLLSDSPTGLVIRTHLKQLPAGERGFHVHENGSCAPAMKDGKMGAALAAGSHYNPNQAPNHGTPSTGHLGDFPALKVSTDGTARVTLLAPRVKLADIKGRALMIHAGGDNYSDHPLPLGGGGERIACGVI